MAQEQKYVPKEEGEADVAIWKEVLFGAEILLLHASPVFYGLGIPHGDNSGVVLIPGFLGTDSYLSELHSWLKRIGYQPYTSGFPINADCPNLLMQRCLRESVAKAFRETGRKVHLVGHSLGGVIARSFAGQHPEAVASVITLASPFRGMVAHRSVIKAAAVVREIILQQHGKRVLPDCYTAHCTCDFICSLRCNMPNCVVETAIYTINDGIVDWRCCVTGDPSVDVEVPGTHIGLAFNASVYATIADRLSRSCK